MVIDLSFNALISLYSLDLCSQYMEKKMHKLMAIISAFTFLSINSGFSTEEKSEENRKIIFQHSLEGFMKDKLEGIVVGFNQKNPEYQIVLNYGGDYSSSFKSLNEKKLEEWPHLFMVAEFNTASMHEKASCYRPLSEIIDIERQDFFPVIQSFYSFKGKMTSYPFNCSTAAVYYNKEAFKKAGLPDRAPQNWEELEEFLIQLHAHGKGGMSTAWPAGYMLEHYSVVNNIPYADHENGFENPKIAKLKLQDPRFISHLKRIQDWHKKGFFEYVDRRVEGVEKLFAEGKISILMQGINRSNILHKNNPNMQIGVGPYLHSKELVGDKPYALNIGGTSIWISEGKSEADRAVQF